MKRVRGIFAGVFAVLLIGILIAGCEQMAGGPAETTEEQKPAATPSASPAPGAVALNTGVTLSTATEGAEIYYTTDGSAPDKTKPKYGNPITIDRALTIKAITVKEGMLNSDILTATYTIDEAQPDKAVTPSADPAPEAVTPGTMVTLSTATEGAEIYYTTDGSAPDTAKTRYTAPISITQALTIKAIAVKPGMAESDMLTAVYTLKSGNGNENKNENGNENGNGSENGNNNTQPDVLITIGTAEDLAKIGVDNKFPLAGNYVLAADLELAEWIPIGPGEKNAFTGNFDGANHTITLRSIAGSVFVDGTSTNPAVYLGVFGYTKGSTQTKAVVRDLTVRTALNHSITKKGEYYAGVLAGCAGEYTELSGIRIEGSLSFSNDNTASPRKPVYVGGVTGALIASELRDSSNAADIYAFGKAQSGAYNYAGGLVGIFDRNAVKWGMNPAVIEGEPFAGSSIVNCSNTGNVRGATSGSMTNVFAGGIAGGSCYGFKTYYSGRIEDCWSTGNIRAEGAGYWSWAGGIAGTICGDGDGYDNLAKNTDDSSVTGPTRIVRCYARGDITINGPSGSWPYVGGVVGYNYYGAVVSQCYFTGTVSAEGENIYDYTGGIAGYNSQLGGHPSIVEDCWSSGTVSGRVNAGGVVGQNQVFAITRRCYSTASLTVRAKNGAKGNMSQQGAGGIAGYNAGTISNCAALNPSIASTGGFSRVYRVVGDAPTGELQGNAAFSGMAITITPDPSPPDPPETREPDPGADARDGEGCAEKPAQGFYTAQGWDFTNVWKMDGEGYPVLRWQGTDNR